jgi:hypothetical protein
VPQPGLILAGDRPHVDCRCHDSDSRSWREDAEDMEDRWLADGELCKPALGLEIMGYWAVNSIWTSKKNIEAGGAWPTMAPTWLRRCSSVPRQSTCLRPGLGRGRSHMGYGAAVYGWGRGSGVFSTCVRRSFS